MAMIHAYSVLPTMYLLIACSVLPTDTYMGYCMYAEEVSEAPAEEVVPPARKREREVIMLWREVGGGGQWKYYINITFNNNIKIESMRYYHL